MNTLFKWIGAFLAVRIIQVVFDTGILGAFVLFLFAFVVVDGIMHPNPARQR